MTKRELLPDGELIEVWVAITGDRPEVEAGGRARVYEGCDHLAGEAVKADPEGPWDVVSVRFVDAPPPEGELRLAGVPHWQVRLLEAVL